MYTVTHPTTSSTILTTQNYTLFARYLWRQVKQHKTFSLPISRQSEEYIEDSSLFTRWADDFLQDDIATSSQEKLDFYCANQNEAEAFISH